MIDITPAYVSGWYFRESHRKIIIEVLQYLSNSLTKALSQAQIRKISNRALDIFVAAPEYSLSVEAAIYEAITTTCSNMKLDHKEIKVVLLLL